MKFEGDAQELANSDDLAASVFLGGAADAATANLETKTSTATPSSGDEPVIDLSDSDEGDHR